MCLLRHIRQGDCKYTMSAVLLHATAAVASSHLESHFELFAGHRLSIRASLASSHLTVCAWHTLVCYTILETLAAFSYLQR